MQKKQTILAVASLLVVVLSVTLAYFTAQIIGKGKNVTINSADLKIIFTDSDGSISGTNIEPGKWNVTKTFTIENKSNETYKYNIVIQDLVNTFVTNGYLQYKITSTNGGYNMTEFKDVPKSSVAKDTILAYSVSIPVGVTQSYTVEFKYSNDESVDQSEDMGKTLSGKLFITEVPLLTLLSQILKDNPTRDTRDTYDAVFTNNTTGTLFTATEKNVHNTTDTTVYYYAGNTTNNWVKFAGFYWRIIRTNADGSIRMLYSGTSHDTTNGYLSTGTKTFNSSSNSPKYVGYMYGNDDSSLLNARTNTNNSTIKTYVDNWYKNNLTDYTKYLSNDAVYCNDRNLASGQTYSTTNYFYYASSERIKTNKQPTYNCTNMSDAFSVNNTSAKLDYPVGLITIDELSYAGGIESTKLTAPYAWYYTNANGESITGDERPWSLSPVEYLRVWYWNGSNYPGNLSRSILDFSHVVRPSVSLLSCNLISRGDGSPENPYVVYTGSGVCE